VKILVFIRVVEYFKNNLKNILFLWKVNLSLYQQLIKKQYDTIRFKTTLAKKTFKVTNQKQTKPKI
jgi:hypothetical protein